MYIHVSNFSENLPFFSVLEERQRTRELRSAHPPSEDYLLKCREKEIRREKVYSLFRNALGHLALLMVLIILANNVNVYKRFMLNEAILSSLKMARAWILHAMWILVLWPMEITAIKYQMRII